MDDYEAARSAREVAWAIWQWARCQDEDRKKRGTRKPRGVLAINPANPPASRAPGEAQKGTGA